MKLPDVIEFEGLGPCYFDRVSLPRVPAAGEFYLVGTLREPRAARAQAGEVHRRVIVMPTRYAVLKPIYIPGGIVKVPALRTEKRK